MDILLEFNTSGEVSKSGFVDRESLFASVEQIAGMRSLKVRGLMTIAPLTEDRERIRRSFASLREIAGELSRRFPALAFDELSMGMSNDFEIAIEEGATLVRIGSALFGERAKP